MLLFFFQGTELPDSTKVDVPAVTQIVNQVTEKLLDNLDKVSPIPEPNVWQQATFTSLVIVLILVGYALFRLMKAKDKQLAKKDLLIKEKEEYIQKMNEKAFGLAETIANFRHNLESKASFEQAVMKTSIQTEKITLDVQEGNKVLSSLYTEVAKLATLVSQLTFRKDES